MRKQLLTLAEAQREIGWNGPRGRRLKRYLDKREKKLGKRIMLRMGPKSGTGCRYGVTMSALRRWCPELFAEELGASTFREYIKGIDERIGSIVARQVADHVEPRLEELWRRDETLANNINELAQRVQTIVGLARVPASARECPPATL